MELMRGSQSIYLKIRDILSHGAHLRTFIFILLWLSLFKSASGATVTLTLDSSSYSVTEGNSVTITCSATNMQASDVVWLYYPSSNTASQTIIYSDSTYQNGFGSSGTFVVGVSTVSSTQLTTTLKIVSVSASDASNQYQCACNVYKTCSTGNKATATATLSVITTTTTTTTTTAKSSSSSSPCLEGAYNTAQYVLTFFTVVVLGVAALLFYLSFYGSIVETFFIVLGILVGTLCIIAAIIVWINPDLAINKSYTSVIIISISLFACLILWLLILQFSIRLCLMDEMRLIVMIIICIDCVFEVAAAVLLIIANVYCSGTSSLPSLSNFSYSYLELIGASLLLIFSFVLILIAGVILFIRKQKKQVELLHNRFKSLNSASLSQYGFRAFVPRSAASSKPRPSAQIQELWFPKNPITPEEEENLPNKPKKLRPSFAKKASELSFINDAKKTETSKTEIPRTGDSTQKPETISKAPSSLSAKKMPETPFDFIWGTDDLPSVLGNNNLLDKHNNRAKAVVGGRKAHELQNALPSLK